MYLISYTLVGDGARVREVYTVAVDNVSTREEAIELVERRFGEGHLHIRKVERVG